MQGLVKLFLPDKLFKDEEYMRDLIERMDRNNDGMIAYEEFVQTVKETGEPDFFRYHNIKYRVSKKNVSFSKLVNFWLTLLLLTVIKI